MSNSYSNKLFLNLLSSSILNIPADAKLFEGVDYTTWKDIEGIARKQSVSALIADKVLSLPVGSLPPKDLIMVFVSQIEQTKALNRKMIDVLLKVKTEYTKVDMPIVLLKGLSVGINYPNPLLRNPGDIDVFIYRECDYVRSIDFITGKGIKTEVGNHIHYKYDLDGVNVENHCRISYFKHKKYDRLFAEWEKELIDKENFTFVEIGGELIKQLPIEMNAFYIFQHFFLHFVQEGVGFRQYCDWLLFLSKYHKEIDSDSFTAIAKKYAMLYPMQVFARASVKYLGISETIFPFKMISNSRYVDIVIKDILNSGNFGFHKPGKKRPKDKIVGMWYSFVSTIKRSIKFGLLSPQHCGILPIKKLMYRLKIGLNA